MTVGGILLFNHAFQVFAKRVERNAALRAVQKFTVAIEIETKRQSARVGHVLRADCSDLRFRLIAIRRETHKMFVE